MEQYLTEFESIVQRRENFTQSVYEGCAYEKLSEVSFIFVVLTRVHWALESYRIGVSDAGFRFCVFFCTTSQSVY